MGRREAPAAASAGASSPTSSTFLSGRSAAVAVAGLVLLAVVYFWLHPNNSSALVTSGLSSAAPTQPSASSVAPKAAPLVAPLDFDCANRPPGTCPKFPDKPELKKWEDVVLCDAPFMSGESHGHYYRELPAYIKRIPQDGGRSFVVDVGVNVGGAL